MSDRVQIDCLKQGAFDSANWSARVLTIDSRTGTLTISRRGHPENTFYHALRPTSVQQWPHFCMTAIDDDYYSVEAKRTICFLGRTVPVPNFTEEEVALVGIPLSASAVAAGTTSPPSTPQWPEMQHHDEESEHNEELQDAPEVIRSAPQRLPLTTTASSGKQRREKLNRFDAWVLRFPSKVAYDVAVHMLQDMFDVHFAGDSQRRKRSSRLSQRHQAGLVTMPGFDS